LLPYSGTDRDYLYYAMLFSVNSMRALTYGTIFGTITTNSFGQWQIPLPSFSEQQAIAAALGDVDALIAALDRLIAKKRAIKQGAMQQLLTGQTRLPGFSDRTGYKQTEVGMIPEDWKAKRIGELFEVTSSKRVFQSEWKTKGVPFYRARELAVLGEQGFVENELFISREMYDAYKNAYGVPKIGDILVTGVGTLGKVYVVSDDHEFYFKDGNIIWFKSSGRASSDYVRQLYLTRLVTKQIENASAGTTVGTYTISGAKETIIPFPPLPEQRAIAAILSDMDAEIAALEARREKTRALKQGMMQELLTGKTRLV
jgi:type I restriction enzyme S subunit